MPMMRTLARKIEPLEDRILRRYDAHTLTVSEPRTCLICSKTDTADFVAFKAGTILVHRTCLDTEARLWGWPR